MRYYLAYGSNLSVHQMFRRCPDAVYVGTAVLRDMRLLFRGSKTGSYLTVEAYKGSTVPVVIWSISEADEARLDVYEGFPRFYGKHVKTVTVHSLIDGQPIGRIKAFYYAMTPGRPLGAPTEAYYETCAEGYIRFGFDLAILDKAYIDSAT